MSYRKASRLLRQHKQAYATYWRWTDGYVRRAFIRGRCLTRGGWPRKVGRKDNPRSVANYPIQGTAADLMRIVVILLTRRGLPLLLSVHDSFIFEAHRDDVSDLIEEVEAVFAQAIQQLLPGAPMRWDKAVFENRYEDKGGLKLWQTIRDVLDGQQRIVI
jgi:DNA polymerase I-like protein with 3'-5' exonuclease and polymerase domains